jgi:hypothetical protein
MTTEQKAKHFDSLMKHLRMNYKWAMKLEPRMSGVTFDEYLAKGIGGNDFANWYKKSGISIDFNL